MPSTEHGAPIISNGRIFITSHERIKEDSEMGTIIVGICLDAKTGKKLWERKIPGTRRTDLSSLFNDNTAASPVSDGDRVVFMNVGSGWVHVSQAPPIVVGYLIYFSTMVGMVYILKWNVEGNG